MFCNASAVGGKIITNGEDEFSSESIIAEERNSEGGIAENSTVYF
jgi:hypothetical protein